MKTKLTFNETTYEFVLEPKGIPTMCIYINGKRSEEYYLEESKLTTGSGLSKSVWVLHWCSKPAGGIAINTFSLNEVVEIIDYINSNKPKERR